MSTHGHRRGERRRAARVTLSVPLRVDGKAISGEPFTLSLRTHIVSEGGCLIPLEEEVVLDQTLVLMNENTRKSILSRVVSTRRHRDGKKYVGLAFMSPNVNFWGITFSKPGARSLKRQYGSANDHSSS